MTLSRRTFIKSSVISALSLPFMQGCRFVDSENDESDRLFMLFQNPPVTSKPFVRWWWNGDKVTAKEILRELDIMKTAGIGGVEINPIRFPGGDDLGIPSLEWLSPEWIEMVKTALKGAEERGMICDIIVGSGWPFGGEFLQPEEQTQLMTETALKVRAGKDRTENSRPAGGSLSAGRIQIRRGNQRVILPLPGSGGNVGIHPRHRPSF